MNAVTDFIPLSVLIVDDEEPVRYVLGWMLEEAGHIVHQALDGCQALDFLRSSKAIDLVLSDINMPGMDGLELSDLVRAEFPTVRILLASGRPPPAGVRAFISKPFNSAALVSAIARLVPQPM